MEVTMVKLNDDPFISESRKHVSAKRFVEYVSV